HRGRDLRRRLAALRVDYGEGFLGRQRIRCGSTGGGSTGRTLRTAGGRIGTRHLGTLLPLRFRDSLPPYTARSGRYDAPSGGRGTGARCLYPTTKNPPVCRDFTPR